MIPMPPGPADIPAFPERPEPVRVTPPPATSLWDELEEVRRNLRDLTERLQGLEERLRALEGHRH